jgi:hypothetical protein
VSARHVWTVAFSRYGEDGGPQINVDAEGIDQALEKARKWARQSYAGDADNIVARYVSRGLELEDLEP